MTKGREGKQNPGKVSTAESHPNQHKPRMIRQNFQLGCMQEAPGLGSPALLHITHILRAVAPGTFPLEALVRPGVISVGGALCCQEICHLLDAACPCSQYRSSSAVKTLEEMGLCEPRKPF